jgi:hypothetical protein
MECREDILITLGQIGMLDCDSLKFISSANRLIQSGFLPQLASNQSPHP